MPTETVAIKIASLALEDEPRAYEAPSLYVHATAPVVPVKTYEDAMPEAWALNGSGTFDFTTFMNGLSVMKWRRYTVARRFVLRLTYKGAAASIWQTRADSFAWESEVMEDTRRSLPASGAWRELELPLVEWGGEVLIGARIETEGVLFLRDAAYYAVVEPEGLQPVELALCTTTYHRERYIERTIKTVRTQLLESADELADHLTFHVVDNGRSLDVDELLCPGIVVHPNVNAGGAGGFARGMLEALDQKRPATHVLLMDDDIELSPESVRRTYALLRIARDAYRDAFVSGAMMNAEEPDIRIEDTGFMSFAGNCRPTKPVMRMSAFHDVIVNETFISPEDVDVWGDVRQKYAAWWFCCIPAATIRREGLPLPLFVRFDDVEYGNRCHPPFMTMNGICVWHEPFGKRYDPAVERFLTMRNSFIIQATTGVTPQSDYLQELRHHVHLELKKFNYADAELALAGFEEFLRGPWHLMTSAPDENFRWARAHREALLDRAAFASACQEHGIALSSLTLEDIVRDYPRSRWDRLLDYLLFNGQRADLGYVVPGRAALIDATAGAYPAGRLRRSEYVLAIDARTKCGACRHLDRARWRTVWRRYRRDVRYYRRHRTLVEGAWRAVRTELTSPSFWRTYLQLDRAGACEEERAGREVEREQTCRVMRAVALP